MQPDSLVFVAIVALWAAYLLPQWIRRRDALGASRGEDRHSEGLRVLSRRRRRLGTSGRSSAPILTATRVVVAPTPGPSVPLPATVTAKPPAPARPVHTAARRRAVVLSVLLAVTLLTAVGALTGGVPAGLVLLPLVLLALDVAALRSVALRRRRSALAARDAARIAAARRQARDRRLAEVQPPAPRPEPIPAPVPAPPAPAVPEEPAASDDSWVPVPVPPPTYTLKPMAPRPEPAPLELPQAPVPAPAPAASLDDEADVDLDSVLERRRAVNG